jgi:hypothetical protein
VLDGSIILEEMILLEGSIVLVDGVNIWIGDGCTLFLLLTNLNYIILLLSFNKYRPVAYV